MFPKRPEPRFKVGAIVSLHNGGYVVVKNRMWAPLRAEERKEWVYTVVRLKFSLETGDLLHSPHEQMGDDSLKWEMLIS